MNFAFSQAMAESFKDDLSNSPVQFEVAAVNPLTLDENIYNAKIDEFNPDDVLIIRVQSSVIDPFGGYPSIRYDASLMEAITKKREWRAIIDSTGDTGVMNRRMKETAETIISRLKQDGFLQ